MPSGPIYSICERIEVITDQLLLQEIEITCKYNSLTGKSLESHIIVDIKE